MSCDDLRDAILDAARGVSDAGLEEQVRAHLDACDECARHFEEQRRLTGGLRALARADLASADADAARFEAMEEKLLAAFDERHVSLEGSPSTPVSSSAPSVIARARRSWVPLAAAAALAVAAFAGWDFFRPGDRVTSEPAATATASGPTRPDVGAGERERGATPPAAPPELPPTTGRTESLARTEPTAAAEEKTPAQPALIVAEGFTPLPLATLLPTFESGEIVRTSVAPAALPAFGLEIPADAGSDPVPVDFLVGQDGHPRAIRLVTQAVDGTTLR